MSCTNVSLNSHSLFLLMLRLALLTSSAFGKALSVELQTVIRLDGYIYPSIRPSLLIFSQSISLQVLWEKTVLVFKYLEGKKAGPHLVTIN